MGICSTGIDFQLGTNAADSNGSFLLKQTLVGKLLKFLSRSALHSIGSPRIGSHPDHRSVNVFSSNRVLEPLIPRQTAKTTRKSASI